MSGVRMVITFEDAPLREQLERLAQMSPVRLQGLLANIGEDMVGDVQDNIDSQKLADGGDMPQSKSAQERKGKTLLDRGHLRDSYVYQLNGGVLEVGSNLVYAAAHHYGLPARTLTAKNKSMLSFRVGGAWRRAKSVSIPALPARPVLGMTERRERLIGDLFIREIGAAP